MFINSKKCFEIREGENVLVIPRDFIGSIPDWAARHWLVQAAIQDGSIATPGNTSDKALEAADETAVEMADGTAVEMADETAKGKARKA